MNVHLKSSVSAIAFSFLFYCKSFGLNMALIAVLVIVFVATWANARPFRWVYALAYFATAVFVFINPTVLTVFVNLMALLVFVGKSVSPKNSVLASWFIGAINMVFATPANYIDGTFALKAPTQKFKSILIGITTATLLLIIFTLLYRNANPIFDGLIDGIDLGFISVPWIMFTLFGHVLFLNLLRPYASNQLGAYDTGLSDFLLRPADTTLIDEQKKLENEHTWGIMVFGALNLLLALYLVTDGIYLLQIDAFNPPEYSQSVHQGVYALMFSIVIAIVLIIYFFRGNLNFFEHNKKIKVLTYLWIGLNVLLIAFTTYKNYGYVEALGLTYKRIGVFVYLLLTLTGLVTAFIKVANLKSFAYLARTNFATLFFLLTVSAAVPWNRLVTGYNLTNIVQPDLDYLIGLPDDNSVQLYSYVQTKPDKLSEENKKRIGEKYDRFSKKQAEKTWQEYSFGNLKNLHVK